MTFFPQISPNQGHPVPNIHSLADRPVYLIPNCELWPDWFLRSSRIKAYGQAFSGVELSLTLMKLIYSQHISGSLGD